MSDLNNNLNENYKVQEFNKKFQNQNNNYENMSNFNVQQCPPYTNNIVQTVTNNENINNAENQQCLPYINNTNNESIKYDVSKSSTNDQINQNIQNYQNNQSNQNINYTNYNNNQHNQGIIIPFTNNIQNMNNIRCYNNLQISNQTQNHPKKYSTMGTICCYICGCLLCLGISVVCTFLLLYGVLVLFLEPED